MKLNLTTTLIVMVLVAFLSHWSVAEPNGMICQGAKPWGPWKGGDGPCGACSPKTRTRTLGTCVTSMNCNDNCEEGTYFQTITIPAACAPVTVLEEGIYLSIYILCMLDAEDLGDQIVCECAYNEAMCPCVEDPGSLFLSGEGTGCL